MRTLIILAMLACCLQCFSQPDSNSSAYEKFKQARDKALLSDSLHVMFDERAIQDSITSNGNAEFQEFTIAHHKRAYMWQFISSIIIFVVVISIVLSGLYLSYQQFNLSKNLLLKGRPDGSPATEEVAKFMNANLEVSKEGFKINSAVIGLVILMISLTFFFLYLKYVYPINVIQY
jgi:hypothetical protein